MERTDIIPRPASGRDRKANGLPFLLRMGVTMFVALWCTRILLERLGITDFGVYNVVAGVVTLMGVINGALLQSTTRFVTFSIGAENDERIRKVFGSALLVHLLTAMLCILIGETAGLWFVNHSLNIPVMARDEISSLYQWSLITVCVVIMRAPYEAMVVAHEKTRFYSRMILGETLLRLVSAWLLVYAPEGRMVLYGELMFLVTLLVTVFYYRKARLLGGSIPLRGNIDRECVRDLGMFAGLTLFRSGAWIVRTQGLNVLLNIFCGAGANAAFSIANQVGASLGSFASGVGIYLQTPVVKAYSKGEIRRFILLVTKGSSVISLAMIVVGGILMICTEPFLELWLGIIPDHTVIFTRLIVAASIIEGCGIVVERAQGATGKVARLNITTGATVLLTLPAAWIILRLGYSADIVFLFAVFLSAVMLMERIFILRRTFRLQSRRKISRV